MTTEARILDSALQTFARRGYKNASIREIAERAGVNALTVFRYFHDKETLFLTAVRRALPSRFSAEAIDAELTFRDAEEDLRRLAYAYVRELSDNIGLIRIFIGEATNFAALRGEAWFVSPVLCAHFAGYVRRLEGHTAFAETHAEELAELFVSYLTRKIVPVSKAGEEPAAAGAQALCAGPGPRLRCLAAMLKESGAGSGAQKTENAEEDGL